MTFTRATVCAGFAAIMAFACRSEDTRPTDDKDGNYVTPAGHTAHETGVIEREPNDVRGVPDYAETRQDAGVGTVPMREPLTAPGTAPR